MSVARRRLAAALAAMAGVALGVMAASAWNAGVDPRVILADLAVGSVYVGSGVALLALGRAGYGGALLAMVGLAWFAGTIWPSLEFLHRGPLLHLLVTYPSGRFMSTSTVAGWLWRGAVLAAYLANLTRLGGDPTIAAAYAALLVVLVAPSLVEARGALRRTRLAAAVAGMAVAVVLLAASLARLAGAPLGAGGLYAYEAVLVVVGVGLALDLLRGGWSDAVTQVVMDLGDAALGGTVRQRLAHSLGDPSFVLAYAKEGSPGSFVDEVGKPVTIPQPSAERAVVPLAVAGREYGFMAGERALLDDPRLVESLSAAAVVARSNATLQAEIRARVADVAASRERLVHAADAERRRLERRLQHGALRHVERAAALLELVDLPDPAAQASSLRLREELDRAVLELTDFARGIHPASLTDDGLPAAMAELAARTPVPTHLTVAADVADPLTAATIYFVSSEAIANAVKHAAAGTISIEVRETEAAVHALVRDDGRGGARIVARGGLAGLADRVEALGGTLHVDSQRGVGTSLTVTLPRRERALDPGSMLRLRRSTAATR